MGFPVQLLLRGFCSLTSYDWGNWGISRHQAWCGAFRLTEAMALENTQSREIIFKYFLKLNLFCCMSKET